MNPLDRAARAVVGPLLAGVDGLRLVGSAAPAGGRPRAAPAQPEITLEVTDARFYRAVLLSGHLGAAEAYL
jgi:hypothetical protein